MYDFQTIINRKGKGSSKWEDMFRVMPDVPEDIVPLSVADMELKAPPELIAGLKKFIEDDLVVGYSTETDEYRSVLRAWMKKRHHFDIEDDWVAVSNGVVPAFFTAVNTFTKPGEGVIILTPVYYPFYNALRKQGREIIENPLIEKDGRYEIDFDDLAEKCRDQNNTMVLFCSPHNPVGRVWTREELEKVAEICLANDVLIVSDEIHMDLVMPGYQHTVLQTLSDDIANHCITCTAPSKTFNIAGLQCSNIIIKNPELREKFVAARYDTGSSSLNTFAYQACLLAYRDCENWLDALIQHIASNEKLARDFFAREIPQILPTRLEGTYLQWWDCRALNMDKDELERFMTQDALLFLDEGYVFGKQGAGFERINLACPASVLENALYRLKEALHKKNLL